MPSIALYLSIKLIPDIGVEVKKSLNVIYLVLFFSTIIMPLISVLFLIKKNVVSSLEMKNYREKAMCCAVKDTVEAARGCAVVYRVYVGG